MRRIDELRARGNAPAVLDTAGRLAYDSRSAAEEAMPTIRDVVEALARRDGVEAVIILGADGLPIDSRAANGADPEVLSALVPSVIQAADALGQHARRGELTMGVIEFKAGFAVIVNISADAKLLIIVGPRTNVGPLLYDLSRHRAEIAGLL